MLGDVVDRHELRGGEAGHRRRVDDVPLVTPGEHAGQECPHAVDHAPEVHVDDPLPVGERVLVHGADHGDAGVVAEHVGGAECFVGLARQPLDVLGAGDVDPRGEDGRSFLPDLVGRLRERVHLDVGHDDLHALGGEALGESEPDAARRARHHRHAIPELFHARVSLRAKG